MKKTAGDNYEYAMLAEKSSNISSNPLMGGPETVLKQRQTGTIIVLLLQDKSKRSNQDDQYQKIINLLNIRNRMINFKKISKIL